MKLLYCYFCGEIFSLGLEEKRCRCGEARGKYLNSYDAEYFGRGAIPLGIENGSFNEAVKNPPGPDDTWGKRFEAFVIPRNCKTFTKKGGENNGNS